MSKSLLEQLPGIVAAGKRQAGQILEQLEGRNRVSLQTRELVIPSKDHVGFNFGSGSAVAATEQPNRLIYGDNLLAMSALLAGDEDTPSLRGTVDLIYIDPPFDSKADYRTKISLPGTEIERKPTVLEQFAYSDTWADGTASYSAMITPRIVLMRELLSDSGSIYVHLDWHVAHYVKIVLDEVFGRSNFLNEIVWKRTPFAGSSKARSKKLPVNHDVIFSYSKGSDFHFQHQYEEYSDEYKARFKHFDGSGHYRKTLLKTYSKQTEERLKREGRWINPIRPGAYPSYKQYLHESKGKQLEDIGAKVLRISTWTQMRTMSGKTPMLRIQWRRSELGMRRRSRWYFSSESSALHARKAALSQTSLQGLAQRLLRLSGLGGAGLPRISESPPQW